ncbi:dihydroneopterin aldolase [Spelaeicoccus albus]|uniref:7,8-dihydroneopterin aldolase n=1 Tax=Spelaeicoccus albus TaxID=1280376 RepID=A0A7Z0D5S7_9MICO|nr:dihydroneopterin aldolase [Spelaeicoccus albus]NYI69431.1 dihydroneopterin aldolase [Spelaeicoccus albus]
MDRIALRGLTVFGRHGVFDHERRDGQDFVVDLVLSVPLEHAARTDDVADTVHYGELADAVAGIVAGEPVNLLETLADSVATEVLRDTRIAAVDVTIHKPHAPIEWRFSDVSVTVSRKNGR